MSSQIIEREYSLALRAALHGNLDAFEKAERRLRTLDRHGAIEPRRYTVMRLAALARAGKKEEFRKGIAELSVKDKAALDQLRSLLESAPEAKFPAFRVFIEKCLPANQNAAPASRRAWLIAGSVISALAVLSVIAFFALRHEGEPATESLAVADMLEEQSTDASSPEARGDTDVSRELHRRMMRTTGMVALRLEVLMDDGSTVYLPISLGSGFVIGRDGLVLTNRHVVDSGREFQQTIRQVIGWDVVFLIGSDRAVVLPARIAYQSAYVDLALLRVEHEFPDALAFGPTASPGQTVQAYGFPGAAQDITEGLSRRAYEVRMQEVERALQDGEEVNVLTVVGQENLLPTVTGGIVSAIRHTDQGIMLQTDTAINPGNSGGPLIDEHGRVVGVATLMHAMAEGINLCISSRTVFEELRDFDGIVWPDSF